MLFTSPAFVLGFLPVTLGGFWFFGRNGRTTLPLLWLFLASLSFYAWWRPVFVPLLIASIAANYILGTSIARAVVLDRRERAQILMVIGVTGNLLLLGWFKYAGFFFGVNSRTILPLGISFFTFQQIAFLVDAQRGIQSVTPPLAYASFVAFFPHLIAGPIVRAREIVPQLSRCGARGIQSGAFTAGCTIFLLGLAKKLVLADTFAHFADIGFDAAAHDGALTFFEAWYAALAYALQIYYDFSGYSDMAIGLARMFNVGFPLNFDSPYQATTIAEFWRRWHITLGNFLREYVYIPLGGNRRGESRRITNLMATMLLGGLWHGAGFTFVLWGGLHGLFLATHALWRRTHITLPKAPAWAITLLAVVIAWVPFRAVDMRTACAVWRGMAGLNGILLPRMVMGWLPSLSWIAQPAGSLPFLGDGRTLSFPEVTLCLGLGWFIALTLPNLHCWSETWQRRGVVAGFALTMQAMFFAPSVTPFLYFQF